MRENPKRFPLLLVVTLVFVSLLLGSFGVLGYLTYGRHVCAVLSKARTQIASNVARCY